MTSRTARTVLIVVVLLLVALWGAREVLKRSSVPTIASAPAPVVPPVVPSPAPPSPSSSPASLPPASPKVVATTPTVATLKPAKPQGTRAMNPTPKKSAPPIPVVTTPALVPAPIVAPPVPATPEPQEWKGSDTAITHPGQIVVRSDHQLISFWSEHHPHEVSPDIDFSHDMLIGVFAGPRPADSFSISILGMRTVGNTVIVDYREQSPPPGTFSIGVEIHPYDLKVVPKTPLPVKFNLLAPAQ